MARQVFINVDTTLNEIQVTDSDTATGEVFLDYHGKIGQPLSLERADVVVLTDADAMIKVTTTQGESGFFKFADIDDVQIDGVTIGAADLADVLNGIGSYFFTPVGGVPVPSASTVTFNYASGNQYKSFHRIGFAGSATAATLTNVTSYTIYQNGALITPLVFPLALAQNDRLYIEVVATNTALPASIELAVTGITSAVAFNSLSYYYPRTMSFKEGAVELADMMLHTDQAFKGTANLGSGLGNCIYGDPVAGEWDMIYVPAAWNFTGRFNIGMNDRSTSDTTANRYSRVRYCISLFTNSIEIYEFNVNKASVGVANNNMMHMMIRSRMTAPGVYTVTYHYSSDNQASWVLLYTSLSTHDGTVNFYPDLMPQTAYFAEIKPPILKKI